MMDVCAAEPPSQHHFLKDDILVDGVDLGNYSISTWSPLMPALILLLGKLIIPVLQPRASQVAQWLRIHLPMQEMQV